jgi:hypothetical protein
MFIYFKEALISVKREILYNILKKSGISMKKVRLTKILWLLW